MLLIITKPLSGVGHDKFSSRFGVEISYSLSLDIHPVTSRAFFMETVYNFNDFYPFPKIWFLIRFLFLHSTTLFLLNISHFQICCHDDLVFDHIIEPRAPFLAWFVFWPNDHRPGHQQKALHRNLEDTRKTWSGQKTNISSQSVVRKIQIERQSGKVHKEKCRKNDGIDVLFSSVSSNYH